MTVSLWKELISTHFITACPGSSKSKALSSSEADPDSGFHFNAIGSSFYVNADPEPPMRIRIRLNLDVNPDPSIHYEYPGPKRLQAEPPGWASTDSVWASAAVLPFPFWIWRGSRSRFSPWCGSGSDFPKLCGSMWIRIWIRNTALITK